MYKAERQKYNNMIHMYKRERCVYEICLRRGNKGRNKIKNAESGNERDA